MNKNKIIAIVTGIIFIVIIAILGCYSYNLTTQNEKLQEQYNDMAIIVQKDEQALLLFNDWYMADGYEDAESWLIDYNNYKAILYNVREKVETSDNAEYITSEQFERLSVIEQEVQDTHSVVKLRALNEEFSQMLQSINEQRKQNEEQLAMQIVSTINTYSSYYENFSYNLPTSGLTKSGGVNYYDGRTETYYSSNVLYHYRTNEWTVDDEGFYRTNDGYYVVAASDMVEGTVFEGSKGDCIVLDTGCDPGVTDYYVNWN